jgi:hypothetical protein
MIQKTRSVVLNLNVDDVKWLEQVYGETWYERMEQHIHHEVRMRRQDDEKQLKMRGPWNY